MTQQHFTTKSGDSAWLDVTQVRSIIGQGNSTKMVLDGGHAVTVEGDAQSVRGKLLAASVSPAQVRSVSCDATGTPDFYLALDECNAPSLDGQPLGAVEDKDVLTWAHEAVRHFLSTGERAKVPGKAS